MSRGWKDICPVCGNYMQDDFCLRCHANASTRSKRWRRGDKGGVRPERRKYYKPNLGRKRTEQPTTTTRQVSQRHHKKKAKPNTKFLSALQGEWYSYQKKIRVNIDLAQNRWVFKLSNGQRLVQHWHPQSYSSKEIIFTRKDKEITATIGKGGLLMMMGKSGPVAFANVQSGKRYRLCKWCHRKSDWWRKKCKYCRSRF